MELHYEPRTTFTFEMMQIALYCSVTDVAVNADLLVQHNALSVREYTQQMECFGRKEWKDAIENKQVKEASIVPATFIINCHG